MTENAPEQEPVPSGDVTVNAGLAGAQGGIPVPGAPEDSED